MCHLIRVTLNMPEYYFKNNVSGHSIRRTCAINLAENKVDPLARAEYMATDKNLRKILAINYF